VIGKTAHVFGQCSCFTGSKAVPEFDDEQVVQQLRLLGLRNISEVWFNPWSAAHTPTLLKFQ
jgi:hypothetical protein